MNLINALSLFDGLSCGQMALKNAGFKIDNYYAAEIETAPIMITTKRFPNTIHIGDVRYLKGSDYKNIHILFGGSPCQGFSMTGKKNGMVTKENIEVTSLSQYLKLKKQKFEFDGQSYLFWEFVRILKEVKPKYFLLENVRMSSKWEKIISKALGVKPIKINSSLLTAQNRERWYWTNIPNVTAPKDMGIKLSDVIPGVVSYGVRGQENKKRIPGEKKYILKSTTRKDEKANCVVTTRNTTQKLLTKNGDVRHYTVEEAEMLQGIPIGYTDIPGVSLTARYKSIGNAWTVPVVSHIFKFMKKNLATKK